MRENLLAQPFFAGDDEPCIAVVSAGSAMSSKGLRREGSDSTGRTVERRGHHQVACGGWVGGSATKPAQFTCEDERTRMFLADKQAARTLASSIGSEARVLILVVKLRQKVGEQAAAWALLGHGSTYV